jgi:hypothetical protein
MFNDRYGLTDAVIEGRKTNTRRIVSPNQRYEEIRLWQPSLELEYGIYGYTEDDGWVYIKPKYRVGEIVSVAQSYEQVYRQGNMDADDAIIRGLKYDPGMCNKMYVRAALMPHQIRIMGIRCERLQDISDEDCMREGVRQFTPDFPKDFPIHPTHFIVGNILKNTPREAFAALIDKVSGRGTWGRNPWVVAYEFELVK